jgi:hypothetical protein
MPPFFQVFFVAKIVGVTEQDAHDRGGFAT